MGRQREQSLRLSTQVGHAHDNDVGVEFTVRLPAGDPLHRTGSIHVAGATGPRAGTVDGELWPRLPGAVVALP
jgi:hypothetical protein